MTETPTASDWAAARGEKWLAQLASMEAMLAPVDAPLIEALQLDAPFRIADIGCGGGGTTLAIARQAQAGSAVHGFDISPALIEAARARASGDKPIAFSLADVGTARAPQPPYDRLVSRFGIMFYDDPPSAFAKLARWLSPGGRFAFAVWALPADNPWMTSVREAAAEAIDVPPPDPEAPGPFRSLRPVSAASRFVTGKGSFRSAVGWRLRRPRISRFKPLRPAISSPKRARRCAIASAAP
jgi:SAM-dependent methyltransferase